MNVLNKIINTLKIVDLYFKIKYNINKEQERVKILKNENFINEIPLSIGKTYFPNKYYQKLRFMILLMID